MTPNEVEQLLEGAEETDVLEFKQAMNWDAKSLVKDILAMANVRDGGRIVFGIEDQTYVRQGLTDDQLATYRSDVMRDEIAPYADPGVKFRVVLASDQAGLKFVIIDVSPFDLEPVICKRDGKDVHAGRVYFRSQTRRPESAAVTTSAEMRQILLRAASLIHSNVELHGYRLPEKIDERLDDELGGL